MIGYTTDKGGFAVCVKYAVPLHDDGSGVPVKLHCWVLFLGSLVCVFLGESGCTSVGEVHSVWIPVFCVFSTGICFFYYHVIFLLAANLNMSN